jgi:hypothetical protein
MRFVQEQAAGGNHVTAYEGMRVQIVHSSNFCWSSEDDDWALQLLNVVRGPCDGTKPCSGWAQQLTVTVTVQCLFLVSLCLRP